MKLEGTIDEIAEQAERILAPIAPGAYCVPQEWDNRIDCLTRLPDGSVIGEMIAMAEATEQRIRDAGERLRQRQLGINVPLRDELRAPIRIVPTRSS
jgi:hypothetical protein